MIMVHNWKVTETLQSAYRLRGQVLFADTGRPAVGARLGVPPQLSPPNQDTDVEARFTIAQLPAGKYFFTVFPPEGSSYLSTRASLDLQGDRRDIEYTVKLPRGTLATGRVRDEHTGEPIAGASVHYYSKEVNESAEATTGADGAFRLPLPSGKGYVILHGVPRGYMRNDLPLGASLLDAGPRFVREVIAGPSAGPPLLEFTLTRGRIVTGRARDPDGKPVRISRVESLQELPHDVHLAWTARASGAFTLSGLKPQGSYPLVLICDERGQAARLSLTPGAEAQNAPPLDVQLEPMGTLTARVVGEDGKPLVGATARLWKKEVRLQSTGLGVTGDPVAADKDGRFTFTGLWPGGEYSVGVSADGYASFFGTEKREGKPGVQALPDIALRQADGSVAGVVVDGAGQPLAGVVVEGHYRRRETGGEMWGHGEPGQTDAQGRFRVTRLPKAPITLHAAVPWGPRQYIPPLNVQAGDQAVRYVVKLGAPD